MSVKNDRDSTCTQRNTTQYKQKQISILPGSRSGEEEKKKVQVFANRITSNKTSAGKKYLESALTKP